MPIFMIFGVSVIKLCQKRSEKDHGTNLPHTVKVDIITYCILIDIISFMCFFKTLMLIEVKLSKIVSVS